MAVNLSPYKLRTLKLMSFLVGCTQASNKTDIQHRLFDRFKQHSGLSQPTRIVSVDMGIRNLAYCVVDAPYKADHLAPAAHGGVDIKVDTWRKLDLTEQLDGSGAFDHHDSASTSEATSTTSAKGAKAGLFSPANVSKLAYTVSKQLLDHNPDVILIEEQRFRSSGGSAIQEWTVRVNMLESMLWACLETLKHGAVLKDNKFPTIYSVNPAKVAKFWIAGNTMSLAPTVDTLNDAAPEEELQGRAKITKKDKIAVLQKWLTAADHIDVSLQFSDETRSIAERFTTKASRRSGTTTSGKLDDLADCLLQGAAWIKWQRNTSDVLHLLKTSGHSMSTAK